MRQGKGERSNERHENMIDADSKEACPFYHFWRSGHLEYATGIPIKSVGLQNRRSRPIWVKFGSGETPTKLFLHDKATAHRRLHWVMHVLSMMPCMQHGSQQTVAVLQTGHVQLDHM